jgi:hypothetical protein
MVRSVVSALRQIGKLVPLGKEGHVVIVGLDGTPLALDRIHDGTPGRLGRTGSVRKWSIRMATDVKNCSSQQTSTRIYSFVLLFALCDKYFGCERVEHLA